MWFTNSQVPSGRSMSFISSLARSFLNEKTCLYSFRFENFTITFLCLPTRWQSSIFSLATLQPIFSKIDRTLLPNCCTQLSFEFPKSPSILSWYIGHFPSIASLHLWPISKVRSLFVSSGQDASLSYHFEYRKKNWGNWGNKEDRKLINKVIMIIAIQVISKF